MFVDDATELYDGEGRGDRRRDAARHRAARDALGDRPALARAPLRDGLPPGGHQPAGHGPAGSAVGVAAGGLRHVRGDDGPDRGRLRPLRVPPAGRRRRRAPPDIKNVSYSAPEDPVQGSDAIEAARVGAGCRGAAGIRRDDEQPVPLPTEQVQQQPVRAEKTPGRNEPCFCGSGKKYKLCHGR